MSYPNRNNVAIIPYDYIICGAGTSGSVLARRLAEDPTCRILVLEAGASDELPNVQHAAQWFSNLGSERDWQFSAEPTPFVNGRRVPLPMGKVLGGSSSINAMIWSRGFQNDWNYFAEQAKDEAWNYASILSIYSRIENWQGTADPMRRGKGGMLSINSPADPNPIAKATVQAAVELGYQQYDSPNGVMLESDGGAALADLTIANGKRMSVYQQYLGTFVNSGNLTILSGAVVETLLFEGKKVTGVAYVHDGLRKESLATKEVVLSLGAMHTPKVLMQSGIGDSEALRRVGIPVRQHLPGVGQNFQDHTLTPVNFEWKEPLKPRNNLAEALLYLRSDAQHSSPDLSLLTFEVPVFTPSIIEKYGALEQGFTVLVSLLQPKSRGRIELTGPGAGDPIRVTANTFSSEDDMKTALIGLEAARDMGRSAAFQPYVKSEYLPGKIGAAELPGYVREATLAYWHYASTAKMGTDEMAVVDANLKVYGFDNLRIADASILPRITTGNTMAPCVVIGERAADLIKGTHGT